MQPSAPGKVWGGSDAEPGAVVQEPWQPWEKRFSTEKEPLSLLPGQGWGAAAPGRTRGLGVSLLSVYSREEVASV